MNFTENCWCDTLAYLLGWGKLILKWHDLKIKGEPVNFPETGFKWNELGALAQRFHCHYQGCSYGKLLSEFEATLFEILALIENLDNQSLYEISWYEKWTFGRMIQFNTSSPMKNMRTKVNVRPNAPISILHSKATWLPSY
ncbi:MAG: ClbS/DfsB family four-helix bundle protein [Alteromonadaceae bacterium]|nr:ClbS/DfsB family four-helix bundle protein [Alteromonadaceae bacterium]